MENLNLNLNTAGATKTPREEDKKVYGVYIKSLLTKKIVLSITEVGKNVKQNLEKKIISITEGKCIAEGFIRPNSVRIISYSSGLVNTENIEFQTVFECMICHPVEGMLIECQTKTITKAGIHAQVLDEDNVIPVVVFVARDHHHTDKYFSSIKENVTILVKVIGIRYELNDPHICVIGKLIQQNTPRDNKKKKGGDSDSDSEDEE